MISIVCIFLRVLQQQQQHAKLLETRAVKARASHALDAHLKSIATAGTKATTSVQGDFFSAMIPKKSDASHTIAGTCTLVLAAAAAALATLV